MTNREYAAILTARRRCHVGPYAHVGKSLNLRPKSARRWWRWGR